MHCCQIPDLGVPSDEGKIQERVEDAPDEMQFNARTPTSHDILQAC